MSKMVPLSLCIDVDELGRSVGIEWQELSALRVDDGLHILWRPVSRETRLYLGEYAQAVNGARLELIERDVVARWLVIAGASL